MILSVMHGASSCNKNKIIMGITIWSTFRSLCIVLAPPISDNSNVQTTGGGKHFSIGGKGVRAILYVWRRV
jgi:hypothetical protein